MYSALVSLTGRSAPVSPLQSHTLAIHAAFLDQGYLPDPLTLATNPADGSVHLQIIASSLSAFIHGTSSQVEVHYKHQTSVSWSVSFSVSPDQPHSLTLRFVGGPVIHNATVDTSAAIADTRSLVLTTVCQQQETQEQTRRHIVVASNNPSRTGVLPWRPEDPLHFLPGHTPEGGDQVGPRHPIFGDPRYDPLGPGNVGEPDYDHEVPPPFGQPVRPRGPARPAPGPFGGPRML